MSSLSTIRITSNDDMSQVKVDTLSPQESVRSLSQYLDKLAIGCGSASVDMEMSETGGAAASGTVTLSSLVADNTVTVGSIVFTAKASPAGATQFAVGADDDETAENLAAAINAHTSLTNVVSASAAAAVVTISASRKLKMGNMIALAISANGSVSGATLSGGTDPTQNVMHCGA